MICELYIGVLHRSSEWFVYDLWAVHWCVTQVQWMVSVWSVSWTNTSITVFHLAVHLSSHSQYCRNFDVSNVNFLYSCCTRGLYSVDDC